MAIPARTLSGVQRVLITCKADSSLAMGDARAICAQLVKKAQVVTSLPVAVASAKDLSNVAAGQGDRLLLQVALSATSDGDRGALAITVTPSRNHLRFKEGPPVKSEAQLARFDNKWVVQGPVDAFAKILGSVPPKLHRPIKSDR